MSCPYMKSDEIKDLERCTLTGEEVTGFIMCDFEYDECPDYLKRVSADKPKRGAHTTNRKVSHGGKAV